MSQRTEFSKDFSKNKQRIDELLQIDKSFDLLYRVVIIGGKKACFYFVDGFCKDEIMEKVLEFLYKIKPEEMPETAHDFLNEKLPYGEIDLVRTENDLIQRCLRWSMIFRSTKDKMFILPFNILHKLVGC